MIRQLLFLTALLFVFSCDIVDPDLDPCLDLAKRGAPPITFEFEGANNTPLIFNDSNFVHQDSIDCIGIHKGYETYMQSTVDANNNTLILHTNDLLSSGNPADTVNVIDTVYINYGQKFSSDTLILIPKIHIPSCDDIEYVIADYTILQNGVQLCDGCLALAQNVVLVK